jgi:hypothetical protein
VRYPVLWLLLAWVTLPAAHAQALLCDSGDTLHAPFTLDAPDIRLNGAVSLGSVFTIGAAGSALPLVLLSQDAEQTICASADSQLLTVEQDGETVSLNTVMTSAADPTENQLRIGTSGASGASLTIVVENASFDTAHDYRIEVTPSMRASGMPLEIAAYGLSEADIPSVEILDERGRTARAGDEALRCAGGQGRCVSLIGRAVYTLQSAVVGRPTDAALALDLADWPEDSVRFRVSAVPYLLVIRAANDAPAPSGAQFTDALGLICDGTPAWTSGVGLHFPGAESVTVTALGDGLSDPVLAVDGSAPRCSLNSSAALFYSLDLPEAFVPVQDTSAQLTLSGEETAYAALRDDASGLLYLVIEGLIVPPDGQLIEVVPNMAMANADDMLTVWVAAADQQIDPVVTWVTSDGLPILDGFLEPYTCDNAGLPEACYGVSASLRGSSLMLGADRRLPLSSEDAVLAVPVFPQTAGSALRLLLTGANGTTGEVVVVMKLVLGE